MQFSFEAGKLAAGCVLELTQQVVAGKVNLALIIIVHDASTSGFHFRGGGGELPSLGRVSPPGDCCNEIYLHIIMTGNAIPR